MALKALWGKKARPPHRGEGRGVCVCVCVCVSPVENVLSTKVDYLEDTAMACPRCKVEKARQKAMVQGTSGTDGEHSLS